MKKLNHRLKIFGRLGRINYIFYLISYYQMGGIEYMETQLTNTVSVAGSYNEVPLSITSDT